MDAGPRLDTDIPEEQGKSAEPVTGSSWWMSLALLLLPMLVYLSLVAIMGDWVMDDAGISYAYAKNLAAGHGFVSQPGRPPVEGFSNFLWVLLLVPLFLARLFDPVVAARVLGAILVLLSLGILQRILRRDLGGWAPALLATLLVAGAPPIVIWASSGLENGLTLFLAVALYACLVRTPRRWELKSGLLTALLAMNHPENALYVAAGCLVLAWPVLDRSESALLAGRRAIRYLAGFCLLFLPFLVFRLRVFGLPFPHTYYAKRMHQSFWSQLTALFMDPSATAQKFLDLARGVAGPVGLGMILVTVVAAVHLARRGRLGRAFGVALAMQAVALGAYMWIDSDWMGEYRFATVATTFWLVTFVMAGFSVARSVGGERTRRWLATAYVAVAAIVIAGYVPRVVRFAAEPPTSLEAVSRQYAFKFNVYADVLGLKQASVLLPDIGGTLLYSHLTVYDLAGLCEPDVVRTLKQGTVYWLFDHPAFYDWVFETVKPTFINTHDFFTYITALEKDPRFARDYVPVNAYRDEYVRQTYDRTVHSGDYVRKDVLRGPEDLAALRDSYRAAPRPTPPLERWLALLAERSGRRPRTAEELMRAGLDARHSAGNPARAAALFARVLKLRPGHYGATVQLAMALDAAGRMDEARPVWRNARDLALADRDQAVAAMAEERLGVEYRPSPGDSMQAGIAALYRLGDPGRAIARFQAVLAENPKHYGASYQLAVALDAAGRRAEATPLWGKVLEMATAYSDQKTADRARERLSGSARPQSGPRAPAG